MTLTAAPPKCDALSEGRAATDWGMFALPCQSRRGLRSFVDAAGLTRYFCAAPGHQHNVERRFGRAETCHICGRKTQDGLFVRITFEREVGPVSVCDFCLEKADPS